MYHMIEFNQALEKKKSNTRKIAFGRKCFAKQTQVSQN